MNLLQRTIDKFSRTIRHWSHQSIIQQNQGLKTQLEASRANSRALTYLDHPKISVILQFFNKRQNIANILENLRLTSIEEVIVIDDGSVDGSYEEWPKYLNRPNDFLLRCNDIFEIRTYDRAIRMARGEFVCLLQDDDLPPPNNLWIEQALTLFDRFPDLVMLGGRDGMDILMPNFNDPVDPHAYYHRQEDIVEWPGVHKLRLHWQPGYVDPTSGIPFRFTTSVNRAPTFLRRKEFLEIGGINQAYAPFQLDDDDACIRAWLAGYKVGFYRSNFTRDFDVGGMTLFNRDRQKQQILKNAKRLYGDHGQVIADGSLQALVATANQSLLPGSR